MRAVIQRPRIEQWVCATVTWGHQRHTQSYIRTNQEATLAAARAVVDRGVLRELDSQGLTYYVPKLPPFALSKFEMISPRFV